MEEDMRRIVHKQVDTLVFGILSPKHIKKMAAAKIVTPELYDKEGYPVDGGLMDIRLGVIDPGLRCKTCGSKLKECPGHFGYIELARPVFHVKLIAIILDLLRMTCNDCGRVLLPQNKIGRIKNMLDKLPTGNDITARRKAVKELMGKLKSASKCPHCNFKQIKIMLDKPTTLMEGEKRLSPIEVRARLEKISDDDLELIGFSPKHFRPEWAVLTILAIPPVTMRPSITLESGERSEDDLTHKLGDIVRINQRLFENINAGAPEIIIEDLWDLLQYHVTTFFDNDIAQLPPARHRSGQPLKTLTARIKSKEGRIRHNLAGKRTNFSARTVISPDPMLNLNEVGVPMVVAMKLTVPEQVTPWNLEYLREFVKKGPKEYPGANYIVRPDGKKKKIADDTWEQCIEELEPGYTVERHLLDGDIAIFNRQPSLHRMSMMCHKVKVLPYKTFRLNPAVCAPYNADFDGDEMNLHIPQTEEARAEAEILMEVQTQLISPRYGLSIISCNEDAISGNYVLTKEVHVPRHIALDLLVKAGFKDFSRLPRKETISGKEIFSMALPEDFEFEGYSKACKDNVDHKKLKTDSYILIKKGMLLNGVVDKSVLGSGSGLLIRTIHKKYGSEKTLEVLNKIYRLGLGTLLLKGFSTSTSDLDIPNEATNKVKAIVEQAYNEVEDLINQYETRTLEAFPGMSLDETLERKILEVLNKARNDAGNVVMANVDLNSNTLKIVQSGAKGSSIHIAQMTAIVGQQAMRGKRIQKGYYERTLSHFRKGDLRPAAHGFIRNSFRQGLSPSEFFFMGMTGRDSLMDTALRTPKSGYLYRRLANAMQDLKVEYDSTVRDAAGKIVQFQYGEDSIDVSRSENGRVNVQNIIDSVTGGSR